MNTYPICDYLHFRDRHDAASLSYRNRAKILFVNRSPSVPYGFRAGTKAPRNSGTQLKSQELAPLKQFRFFSFQRRCSEPNLTKTLQEVLCNYTQNYKRTNLCDFYSSDGIRVNLYVLLMMREGIGNLNCFFILKIICATDRYQTFF